MRIVPIGLKAANEYVAAHHRHHKPVRGCKFCVSVENDGGECCGVAICGRPISRYLDNGTTLEITRVILLWIGRTLTCGNFFTITAVRAILFINVGIQGLGVSVAR